MSGIKTTGRRFKVSFEKTPPETFDDYTRKSNKWAHVEPGVYIMEEINNPLALLYPSEAHDYKYNWVRIVGTTVGVSLNGLQFLAREGKIIMKEITETSAESPGN